MLLFMRRRRNIRILATLGPSSAAPETVAALFEAGADVFRINMSHASHEAAAAQHRIIRALEEKSGRPIGILADLQGPKIRVGEIDGGEMMLEEGAQFRLVAADRAEGGTDIPLPHPELFPALVPETHLLLDDGKIRLRVTRGGKREILAVVEVGGILRSRKGLNVPNTVLPLDALTDKDRADLEFVLGLGVDWVALSFVQRPGDVETLRRLVKGRAAIMAKIEKPAALLALDSIVALADGVMVARGDLGVEMHVEEVPGSQKQIIHTARLAGKPVVVATQMLESMIEAPVPTRAEVSDVANAVFEGADAVMLSAESAAGRYPREAVAMMNRIAEQVESEPQYRKSLEEGIAIPDATTADAISAAARQVAGTLNASVIVCYTSSGSTATRVARERPRVPILVLTPERTTARRLTLGWGMHCVLTEDIRGFQEMVDKACRIALAEDFARQGHRLVVTAGVPFGRPGTTNILRIARVEQ